MGIPRYFRHITKEYPDVVKSTSELVNIQNLYFDMNCLIHPCVRSISTKYSNLVTKHSQLEPLQKYQTDSTYTTEFEDKIYNEIDAYLDKLIHIVNPINMVYLAIDGVAPRAKMEQQRTRRYRSVKIKEMEDVIYSKYNINKITFDTNCITPGTIFMYKLSKHLQSYCKKKSIETSLPFILDDCQNKGEGEHKVLQYLKQYTPNDINCIYGLDADLIMLALCSGSKTYLLREEVHFGKVDTNSFLYLDIYYLGDLLYNDIHIQITDAISRDEEEEEEFEIERQDIINDYICLCFLIGNDFLPHLNGIDILTNSINDLLKIYIQIFSIRQRHLVIENSINFIFLRQIITYLYSNEDQFLPRYQKKHHQFKPRLQYSNNMELELEKMKMYPIYNKNTALELGGDQWMDKYYKYYFNINNTLVHKENIDEICNNYIEGLQWNIKYYLEECPSYSWYYKYRAGPCLRELSRYLISRVYPAKFDNLTEFTPLEQLAIVLPIQSNNLWAKQFKKEVESNLKLTGYYPIDFKLDTLNNHFLYQCDPILMEIDHNYIKDTFQSIELTMFEQERNIPLGLYKCGFSETAENISVQINTI
tara:strand:- start:1411 stop:3180 length:1770 start_codon:yes stop_codon:yes gene_type:complete